VLCFALKYRRAIDKITVDKKLPQFRKFELDNLERKVVEGLVSVPEVVDLGNRFRTLGLFGHPLPNSVPASEANNLRGKSKGSRVSLPRWKGK
jgi:hypothetical protein